MQWDCSSHDGLLGLILTTMTRGATELYISYKRERQDRKVVKGAIPASKAREMFERHGFVLEREIDAGAHHYGMILIKK